jgi:integrase
MPRKKKKKETRDRFGSVLRTQITRDGRKVLVFDARKRFTRADGTKGQKFKRCASETEARLALLNFNNELSSQSTKGPASIEHRLHELIEYFRTHYVKAAVFVNGEKVSGYKQNLTKVHSALDAIKHYFNDDPPLSSISFERLRQFKIYLQSTTTQRGTLPAISTVNERLAFLNRVLTVGFEMDWLPVNPFKRGKGLIKQSRTAKRNRLITFEEEIRLLTQLTGERAHLLPYILLAIDTGMRRSEIWDLQWWQVDLELKVIYLTREAASRSKTSASGILPMTMRLREMLTAIGDSRSHHYRDEDLVLGPCDFKRSFQTACRLAGISDLQFRDLRNSASTRMLIAGAAESQVRKITRHHRDSVVFQDSYVTVDVESAQRVGSLLDQLLANGFSGNQPHTHPSQVP